MESDLFGHAKGSFTGAAASKLGMIEMGQRRVRYYSTRIGGVCRSICK